MALDPAMLAQLGAFINAALAGQVATQAHVAAAVAPLATQAQLAAAVAPLATQAQLAAAVAPLATQAQLAGTQAQLAALQAQVAALPTLVQINAAIAAALSPLDAPVNAAAAVAAAAVQAIVAARAKNNHDRSGEAYAVVLRTDGTEPPHWPAGFSRASLRNIAIATIVLLLHDYGLAVPVGALNRRNALALHIGTALL